MDAAGATGAAEESVVAPMAIATVRAEATGKPAGEEGQAVWSDHIAENQKLVKQAAARGHQGRIHIHWVSLLKPRGLLGTTKNQPHP